MKYFYIAFLIFLLPLLAHAEADLSISAQDIYFSTPVLVAGDEVRIYAKIYNLGDEDVSGFISFYQGATLIDDSLVISLPANGSPEEVYIDFIVPEGSFNILALIRGTNPADENSSNNSSLTSLFTPVMDDDRDTIVNTDDNCQTMFNTDQLDNENDGQGDVCDTDDDNDGLSDEVEAELYTDPTEQDSDHDGVLDPDDAFPTDENKAVITPQPHSETPSEAQTEQPSYPSSETLQKVVEEIAKTIQETVRAQGQEQRDGMILSEEEVVISPHAVFSYSRDDWNTFTFTALTAASRPVVYLWDFGDAVTSSKSSVQHLYHASGAFHVTLTMTDENGTVSSETTTVFVPFFHLSNRLILALVVLLVLLLGSGAWTFARVGKNREM